MSEKDLHPDLLSSLEYLKGDNFSASQVPISVDVDANEFHFNDPDRKKELNHIPSDVYLGRRGSHMVAPGLENFQTTHGLGNTEEEEKTDNDTFAMSAISKKKMAQNEKNMNEFKTVVRKIEAPGLLCVMHTKGFNVAHQGGINDAGRDAAFCYSRMDEICHRDIAAIFHHAHIHIG